MIKKSLQLAESVVSSAAGLQPSSLPLIVAWVTDMCNMRCQMCDQWKMNEPELSTQHWFSVLDSAKKLKTLHMTITGGEPFMRKDLFKIIKKAKRNGISVHICSNGTLIDNSVVNELSKCPPNSISISIDSSNPKIHNELRGASCHGKAVNAIKLAKTIPGLNVGINHLICKKNYTELSEMAKLAQKLEVDRLNVMPIHTNLQHKNKPIEEYEGLLLEKKDLPVFEKEFRKFMKNSHSILTTSRIYLEGIPDYFKGSTKNIKCLAGHLTCAVNAQGGVSACDDMDIVANIKDMPLEKIWRSQKFQSMRKKAKSCNAQCWDTTHANLNILLSPKHVIKELGTVVRNAKYYM